MIDPDLEARACLVDHPAGQLGGEPVSFQPAVDQPIDKLFGFRPALPGV